MEIVVACFKVGLLILKPVKEKEENHDDSLLSYTVFVLRLEFGTSATRRRSDVRHHHLNILVGKFLQQSARCGFSRMVERISGGLVFSSHEKKG
jgi:hypothetical protein